MWSHRSLVTTEEAKICRLTCQILILVAGNLIRDPTIKNQNFAHIKHVLVFNNKKHIILYRMWYWNFAVKICENGYTGHHAEWFINIVLWIYAILEMVVFCVTGSFHNINLLSEVDFKELLCLKDSTTESWDLSPENIYIYIYIYIHSRATYYCIKRQCNR